jgi:hypothetical protein
VIEHDWVIEPPVLESSCVQFATLSLAAPVWRMVHESDGVAAAVHTNLFCPPTDAIWTTAEWSALVHDQPRPGQFGPA